jgi:biotin transport system substrate-specific component
MNQTLPVVLSDLIPTPRVMQRGRLRDVTLVVGGALFTALAAQVVVHLGFTPVPLTGQTFAVLTVGGVLGARRAMASQVLYWLLGAVGLPFYAGAASGWSVATGATLGYFVGFVAASGLVGWFADRREDRHYLSALSSFVFGSAVIYLFGALWLAHHMNVPVATGDKNAMTLGVYPFLVGDAVKVALAAAVTPVGWLAYNKKSR